MLQGCQGREGPKQDQSAPAKMLLTFSGFSGVFLKGVGILDIQRATGIEMRPSCASLLARAQVAGGRLI